MSINRGFFEICYKHQIQKKLEHYMYVWHPGGKSKYCETRRSMHMFSGFAVVPVLIFWGVRWSGVKNSAIARKRSFRSCANRTRRLHAATQMGHARNECRAGEAAEMLRPVDVESFRSQQCRWRSSLHSKRLRAVKPFLTQFSSQGSFLFWDKIPAWPFFGKPFFGTRQYCTVRWYSVILQNFDEIGGKQYLD